MTETEPEIGSNITQNERKRVITGKRLCILFGFVVVAGLLVPSVPSVFHRWPKLCCRYGYINVKTGQARYARYLGLAKISEEVADTPISLALEGRTIDVADIEPWHRVYTASPGVISPHYRYHSALSQARQIELIGELSELGLQERRLIAENVLKLWQTERQDFPVKEYLQTVFAEGRKEREQDASNGRENE